MKEEIWNLIIKRLGGEETLLEKDVLDLWLAENPENEQKYNEVVLLWQLTGKLQPQFTQNVPSFKSEEIINRKRKLSIYWSYGIAATCVAALFVFGLKFIGKKETNNLSEWTTLSAAPGKIISVKLPDSSTVVLNAGSTIKYAKNFNEQKNRLVVLSGEAFFDVSHQAEHPFVVESGKLKTVVYGTSFNVRAYKTEKNIEIAVKSGKVGVLKNEAGIQSKAIFLLKQNVLKFDTLASVFSKVSTVTDQLNNWEKGTLIFDQTPIMEVLGTLSRRFNVTFDTKAYTHQSCKLTARFEQKDLPFILRTIQTVMNIKINQIDQTIYLKGGNACN